MNIGDWITVVTNTITAATAVIMAILAYRTYLRTPQQVDQPKTLEEDLDSGSLVKELTVFKTSKQETKLVVTDNGLQCYLDDNRPGKGGLQWTIGKEAVREILGSNLYFVNPGYKANTGLFTIGNRRNWLYSKKFFPEPEHLQNALREILNSTIS